MLSFSHKSLERERERMIPGRIKLGNSMWDCDKCCLDFCERTFPKVLLWDLLNDRVQNAMCERDAPAMGLFIRHLGAQVRRKKSGTEKSEHPCVAAA